MASWQYSSQSFLPSFYHPGEWENSIRYVSSWMGELENRNWCLLPAWSLLKVDNILFSGTQHRTAALPRGLLSQAEEEEEEVKVCIASRAQIVTTVLQSFFNRVSQESCQKETCTKTSHPSEPNRVGGSLPLPFASHVSSRPSVPAALPTGQDERDILRCTDSIWRCEGRKFRK